MQNPQKQIVDLSKSLANRVVDLDSKLSDAKKFYDLIKEERYLEIVNNTPTFFRIHNNSIQRDKFIAHDDPIYFDEPYRINEDAPINLDELDSILNVLREILFEIYSSLMNTHYEMKLVGIRNIDFIVKLLRHQKILFEDDEIRNRMWNRDLPYPVDT